ncbi:glutathione S-transferase [Favolaschia claudopus]|uniref:glutathione transferase n=1 Tax=Favolaschia claudopus TaxID=2862362 RepID=A0AAV9ZHW6_9AGAR
MVLTLYGLAAPLGGTATVAMTLAEKGIPYTFVSVDLQHGEHKQPEFRKKQPFGLVPALDDDGFVLYESRAICRYLAEKYAAQGPTLIPTELKAKALFEQAAAVEFANFEPHARAAYNEGVLKPHFNLPVDPSALNACISKLSDNLDVYEVILGKQRFLAGDEFTLADLFHVAFGTTLAEAGCDLMTSKGPNVKRWWKEVTSRPAWLSVLNNGIKTTMCADDALSEP